MSTRFNHLLLALSLGLGHVVWAQHDGHDTHATTNASQDFGNAGHEASREVGHAAEHSGEHAGAEKGSFDPSPFIIHHVADAYDIHLWGEGEGAVHIPLPVILYSEAHGLDVFMSSAFHGHGDVKHTEDGK